MLKDNREPHLFELFYGGVPPLLAFDSNLSLLEEIVDKCTSGSDEDDSINNFAADTCLIALLSHFEAFGKGVFAAIINICPHILSEFSNKRKEDVILLSDFVRVGFDTTHVLGFLVAERRDFGDLKSVNTLFLHLLGITPFSKEEMDKVRGLQEVRNLLVHHGGVYTSDYAKRNSLPHANEFQIFFHGPKFGVSELKSSVSFLMGLANKLAEVSLKATEELISENNWTLTPYRKRSLDFLTIDLKGKWPEISEFLADESNSPNPSLNPTR